MLFSEGCNEQHHVTIASIEDKSEYEYPVVYLNCRGRIYFRDVTAQRHLRASQYKVIIKCYTYLREYVLSELSEGDGIFAMGITDNLKGKYNQARTMIARYIYKEEWVHYIPKGGTIN